jgi:alpha-L-rhamnosidase
MFGNAAGIQSVKPGFSEFVIRPEIAPDGMGKNGISALKASLHSINGNIVSEWRKSGQKLSMNVQVPVNTLAKIYIPASDLANVSSSGKKITENKDIEIVGQEEGYVVIQAGSGSYSFQVN